MSASSVLNDLELEGLRTRAQMMASPDLFAALRRWEAGDDRVWSSLEDEYAAYRTAAEQKEFLGAEVDALLAPFAESWGEPPHTSESVD